MSDSYMQDDWPKMPDDSDFDGKNLLTLVRKGQSPFDGAWDVNLLIQEVEENLHSQVIEIPTVYDGANFYGLHLKLSNQPDVIARLAHADVNVSNFDGFPFEKQVSEVRFEAALYELLPSEPKILVSNLLYHRVPAQCEGPTLDRPRDVKGRRFFLFEKAEGEKNVWDDLCLEGKASLLAQSARIRASLFNFNLPLVFATVWFRERLFEQKPKSLPVPVASTREFCVGLFASKIEATIGNIGDMIGWESDNVTVGPIAAVAKLSLLRLVTHILPADNCQTSLYRLVLEHGDFGIHNMSVTMDKNTQPLVTSLYDWETGCIVPALLSDPTMVVTSTLGTDENAAPSVIEYDAEIQDLEECLTWASQYLEVLFNEAPDYKLVIQAGRDARHLWFALRAWRGEDPEGYFGKLGTWAERRMTELGVD